MKNRVHILSIVMILTLGSALCLDTWAQSYVAPPVTISKDKVKIDGKVFYSHIVLEKQTLYSIKNAYNVSIEDIYKYNPSVQENGLKKNDIIIIPVVDAPVEPEIQVVRQENIKHTVKWYEDLSSIAAKYNVSENAIIQANGLKDKKLKNRQTLIIPERDTKTTFIKDEPAVAVATSSATVEVEEDAKTENEHADSLEARKSYLLADFWTSLTSTTKRDINAALILPFKATGTSSSRNSMDFYSGVLLAVKEMSHNNINIHLNVYDIATGVSNISRQTLLDCDMIIGPIAPNDITQINELIDGKRPLISPLDQRAEKLTSKYNNLIHAPSSQYSQFTDIANWIKEDMQAGDKVIVISEKEARQNDVGAILKTIIDKSQIDYTPFAYSILEGRDIQETLESKLTAEGINRVVIASESEAFVNDAVRNLNLVVYNKFPVVLYAPAKIRTFETIEVENFHNTSLHTSLTYNIDYDSKAVQDFIRRYRSMFNTEPSQFAYQGYDITKYFAEMISKYGSDWTSQIDKEDTEMLQNSFMFRTSGHGGYINNGIRRLIYGADYSIEEVL